MQFTQFTSDRVSRFEHGDGGFSHRPAHHGYAGIGFHPGTLNPMAATSKDIDRPHQDHDVRLPFRPNFLLLWNRQSSAVFCQSPAHMSHCLHSSSMQLGAEQDARRRKPFNTVMNQCGLLIFAFFLSITRSTLIPFQCVTSPNGSSSMLLHPGIICFESKDHALFVWLAVAGILAARLKLF